MSNRSNAINHYEITMSTGETYADKCRDTLGGYVNLTRRIAERSGLRGVYTRLTSTDNKGGATFMLDGTEITGAIVMVTK